MRRMLPLLWGLWCLTALMQGAPASAAFLPPSVERLFQAFNNIMEQSQEVLGKSRLDPLDFSKLPASYHNEEKKQQTVGNTTVYSHREISKVVNNHTGQILFSEKTVTSVEQGDGRSEERGKDEKPAASKKEKRFEADRQVSGLRFLKLSPPPQPRHKLRLTFLIFRLPQRLRSEQQVPEANWAKEEPVSDRKHRLLAIRNGLLAAPRPVKQTAPPPVTPSQVFVPRKRHFFFFWRKI